VKQATRRTASVRQAVTLIRWRAAFDACYRKRFKAAHGDTPTAADAAIVDPVEAMTAFIRAIRDCARRQDPDFLIIPHSASELALLHDDYLDRIHAIG